MLCHMGEKEESTHMWQAVDRGIGKILKQLYEQEQVCVCVCVFLCVSKKRVHVCEGLYFFLYFFRAAGLRRLVTT